MSLRAGQLIFTTQAGLWKMDVKTYKVFASFQVGKILWHLIFLYRFARIYLVSAKYGLYKINLYNEKDQEFYVWQKGLGDYYILNLDITESTDKSMS